MKAGGIKTNTDFQSEAQSLIKGLANKGFTNFISTSELWDLRQKRLK
jgi:hypothetical protein